MPEPSPLAYRLVRSFPARPVAAAYAALLARLYKFGADGGEKFVVREAHRKGAVRFEVAVRSHVRLGRRQQVDLVFDALLKMGLLAPERLKK